MEYLDALEREIAPPSQRRPEIDPVLDRICLRALRRDPSERYPSAQALAEDLEGYLERRSPQGTRGSGRVKLVGASFALFLAAGLGLAAWLGSGQSSAPPEEPPQDQSARIAQLLAQPPGTTPAELAATRTRLSEVEALLALTPAQPLEAELAARRIEVQRWEELLAAARATPDSRPTLLGALPALPPSRPPDPEFVRFLDQLLSETIRPHLVAPLRASDVVPDPAECRARVALAAALLKCAPPSGNAWALAQRASIRARVDLLVARSRQGEPFDPLLNQLSAILSECPRDPPALAEWVRLELGLLHARGLRPLAAMEVWKPILERAGPIGRAARGEALTLTYISKGHFNPRPVIERVLGEPGYDDVYLYMAQVLKGILTRDARLKGSATKVLLERYPRAWFTASTRGDQHLAGLNEPAARKAYAEAEEASPWDARVWWWRAASLATAIQYASLLSKDVVKKLRPIQAREIERIRKVLPAGAPAPNPHW
tara:strand:- start:1086 stop:2552 length:1467 start_codon:yes stop_codon:yes gene_type:complete